MSISYGCILIFLFFAALLYFIGALVIDTLYPEDIMELLWKTVKRSKYLKKLKIEIETSKECFFESVPDEENKTAIYVKKLTKSFNKYVAIDDVTMNIYENEITILLGHTSAGKTTLLTLLSGIRKPTEGQILFKDQDYAKDGLKLRPLIGISLEHDIVIEHLTVREHLMLFTKLRGMRHEESECQIDEILDQLRLTHMTTVCAKFLTSGMKRRLCFCVAFCGNVKFVLLDEPSLGLDPANRRFFWEFLQKYKGGKTILITTNFMDEAILLGDRIGILVDGKVICYGSKFYLRRTFSTGLSHIFMRKGKRGCDANQILELLQKHAPTIQLVSDRESRLIFSISQEALKDIDVCHKMLLDLEANKKELHLARYQIVPPTLEDIFVKLSNDMYPHFSDEAVTNKLKIGDPEAAQSRNVIFSQFEAVLLCHFGILYRRCGYFVLTLIQLIFLGMTPRLKLFEEKGITPLEINLDAYHKPVVLYTDNFKDSRQRHQFFTRIKEQKSEAEIYETDNITETMLDLTKLIKRNIQTRYIVGTEFIHNESKFEAVAWFNGEGLHAAPIAFNLLLTSLYEGSKTNNISLSFVNAPMKHSPIGRLLESLVERYFNFVIFYIFDYLTTVSFMITFAIAERVQKIKHQLKVSGMQPWIYWIIYLILDWFILAIMHTTLSLTYVAIDTVALSTVSVLLAWLLIALLSHLPFLYLMSFLFKSDSTGVKVVTLLSLVVGFGPMYHLLQQNQIYLDTWTRIMIHVPPFLFVHGAIVVDTLAFIKENCYRHFDICMEQSDTSAEFCRNFMTSIKNCKDYDKSHFQWEVPGIGYHVFLSTILSVFYFAILMLIEFRSYERIVQGVKQWLTLVKRKYSLSLYELSGIKKSADSDVIRESAKILNYPRDKVKNKYRVVMRNVTKKYQFSGKAVVRNLCLGISQGECFCLLGCNGAGKSTIFAMLTGECNISSGDIYVKGWNVRGRQYKTHHSTGYCPQNNALVESLSVRTNLRIFFLLQGVSRDQIETLINDYADVFNLKRCLKDTVEFLSTGRKRLLSIAIGCFGHKSIFFLDEPLGGLDAYSKKHICDILIAMRNSGKSICLTSHDMEFVDMLSTRIAILVNGEFKCLGSVEHIKRKFLNVGCTITVTLQEGFTRQDVKITRHYLKTRLWELRYKVQFCGVREALLFFKVFDKRVLVSDLYLVLQQAQELLAFSCYCIKHATLEETFLQFSEYKEGEHFYWGEAGLF